MADHCALADGRECVGTDGSPMPRGGRFVAASVVVFLLPLLTGILGSHALAAHCGEPGVEWGWQLAGMAAGLWVGIIVARWFVRVLQLHQPPTDRVEESR